LFFVRRSSTSQSKFRRTIYKQTFNELEWSYVAAIGLTLLVILTVLAVVEMRFMKHEIQIEKAMATVTRASMPGTKESRCVPKTQTRT
jgi:hypothetical protein